MDRMAKAFGAVTDVASTAWGYATQLSNSSPTDDQPTLNILEHKTSQSLNGVFEGMIKSGEMILEKWVKYDGMDRMGKAFCAVTDVASTAWGYATQLSNSLPTDQPKLIGMFEGMIKLGKESGPMSRIVKTVGVAVAAWGMYKVVGSFGAEEPNREMMKNPGRPQELIDKKKFRNDPVARKAIFQRTHNLKKVEKCAKGALGIK